MRTITAVVLMGSVVGVACDGDRVGQAAEVRVLRTSYEFQGRSYSSILELEVTLNALPEQLVSISTSSCADESRTIDLVRLVGERQLNVAFSTFEEVCQ
jgi:hypothetical protein